MYNVLDIVFYIKYYQNELQKINKNLCLISTYQNKIHNILYFMQLSYIKENQQPLFAQDIFAWNIGPVIKDIRNFLIFYTRQPDRLYQYIPFEENVYQKEKRTVFCGNKSYTVVSTADKEEYIENCAISSCDISFLDDFLQFFQFRSANDISVMVENSEAYLKHWKLQYKTRKKNGLYKKN